jgi:hypothetical protein
MQNCSAPICTALLCTIDLFSTDMCRDHYTRHWHWSFTLAQEDLLLAQILVKGKYALYSISYGTNRGTALHVGNVYLFPSMAGTS